MSEQPKNTGVYPQLGDLLKYYDGPIHETVLLSEWTSFGIGGPARFFAEISDVQSAASLVSAARRLDLPILFLGGGTNLLVSDDGFDGLALRCDFHDVRISKTANTVTAGAAVQVSELVSTVIAESMAGVEFAAGLPGTIGGAVAGNAGCFGSCFGDVLKSALILTAEGNITRVEGAHLGFEYRRTRVNPEKMLILEAELQLSPGDANQLQETAESHRELRRTRHPARNIKTAGSYFKNLPAPAEGEHRVAAGVLLEQVGAKQDSVGDAAVFEKHANILINRGTATAKDMLTLEALLQRKVLNQFGVLLEPEVRFIGNRPVIELE